MRDNLNGHYNTAAGVSSLRLSTTGSSNAAFGYQALYQNVSGSNDRLRPQG